MIFFVPRDGVSVSGDLLGANNKLIPIVIVPPEPPKVPETLIKQPDGVQGAAGKAHPGKSGAMGDRKSKQARGAYAIQGKSKEPRLGQAEATLAAQSAGILGIFRAVQGSQFASILGSGSAVGDAQENILSTLQSADVANAYGIGGLGMRGSGSGGAGTNLPTLGDGIINTVGHNGYGRDPSVASLRRHITKTPTVTPGIVTTKGSLDKEIIRRVVHLHMNEVKYCFDQELVRKPELQGRVSVQFIISPLGQVIQSFLQSTTMNNARVETCVVSAIKRWEFPKPTGGGIAFVSYPFNFVAGSGG
jgi:hypothetical protein